MYIFMEYCDEGTLEEVSRLGLQEHVIRLYSKQITVATNVLHEHGIVHRDIKGTPHHPASQARSRVSHGFPSAHLLLLPGDESLLQVLLKWVLCQDMTESRCLCLSRRSSLAPAQPAVWKSVSWKWSCSAGYFGAAYSACWTL